MGLSPKGIYDLAQISIEGGTVDEAISLLKKLQAAYPASNTLFKLN